MSDISLSTIQETIERSLFEVVRNEIVDKGYLPNILRFPDTEQGYTDYNTAISDIVTQKGFAIELYSESSNLAKGIKKVPRIVINSGNFLPGALGGDPRRQYMDQGLYFSAVITPSQTVDFFFNIHIVANTVKQERILNSLLALAIQRRGYIPIYDTSLGTFFCRNLNFFSLDDMDAGFLEKVYAYEVPDCWDINDRVVEQNIAKITQINLHPNVMKYIDGVWGETVTDSLEVRYTPKAIVSGSSIVTGNLGVMPPN